jgi:hypothetical protein
MRPLVVTRGLLTRGIIEDNMVAIINNMRGLRNEAAHAARGAISFNAAVEYVMLARRVIAKLGSAPSADSG